ncbi:CopD family protein [Aquisalimonas sp.]|uniref:CopD family protein n=1 Tax=unclassified Aquisalimonas TaxID=2644645 RepID=UPI0025BE7870|nr:CopD family protein [Aquisalimonas sp.]
MFFAYVILRPVAAATLEPPERLMLWRRVLAKFFVWVWKSVVIVLLTGYWLGFGLFRSMGDWPTHVHVMHGLGLIMALLFLVVFFLPFNQLRRAVDTQDWQRGAEALANVRRLVGINLVIGLVVVAVASGGRLGLLG